jgi:adenosylhomocysteine nucleosidase
MTRRDRSRHGHNRVVTDPILVFSALPQESSLLGSWLVGARRTDRVGLTFVSGRLDGIEVVLADSGIGKVAMAARAALAISALSPRAVLFSGVAGGLDPDLEVGDVVVGERLVQYDAGVAEPGGLAVYQASHLPFYNPIDRLGYEPDPALLARVSEELEETALAPVAGRVPRVVRGTILTGDAFVNSVAERRRLRRAFGGAAVEMEGGALAQVCELLDVPCLVIRALSDLAGERAPSPEVFARFLDEACANSAQVLRRILPLV